MRCHARLTRWDSRCIIGTSKKMALKVYVCNSPADGELCEGCARRTTLPGKHEPRLHGLLTEPIPHDSHIYGGAWYWQQVERFGEPPEEWVASAKAQQAAAEQWVEGGWTVTAGEAVKPEERIQPKMPRAKKEKPPVTQSVGVLSALLSLPPLYRVSDKPVLKVHTDYWTIVKGEHNGIPVWILPNGKRFDMDEKGEPRHLIA